MTDNQTAELRRLFDELGVEHRDTRYDTSSGPWDATGWKGVAGMSFVAVSTEHGGICVNGAYITPEQVIAATLGSESVDYMLNTIGKLEEENERLRNSCVMLTAEHVRETVEKHWHDLSTDYDMPEATALPEYSYDWQAIANELNAELGSGTCVITPITPSSDMGRCSACGSIADVNSNYCWKCGAKAVKQ